MTTITIHFDPAEDLNIAGTLPTHTDTETDTEWDATEARIDKAITDWDAAFRAAVKQIAAERGIDIHITAHPGQVTTTGIEETVWTDAQDRAALTLAAQVSR